METNQALFLAFDELLTVKTVHSLQAGMLCLLASLGPKIVGHIVGTYLLLFMTYKASSMRARGHKWGPERIQPWAENEA